MAALACGLLAVAPSIAVADQPGPLDRVQRIVVIYQENHSFDNLLGSWEGVDGLANAPPERTIQVDQNGRPYGCLDQNDPELLKAPPVCSGFDAGGAPFSSHFPNEPFDIGQFVDVNADTCPDKYGPKQLGCTLDLKHSYYQARYELNGGRMNLYATGNDVSAGLAMGHWGTRSLPLYMYLHQPDHPNYAIADRFFAGAIGGSFLNHQWLIAARTPTWPNADNDGTISKPGDDEHSVVDANGMPSSYDPSDAAAPSLLYRSPLENATKVLVDAALTASCNPKQAGADTRPKPPPGVPCGDFAVNTVNPPQEPTHGGKRALLPLQRGDTIGERLSDSGKSWAWFSAGWSNADGDVGEPGWTNGDGPLGKDDCPDKYAVKKSKWPFCPDVAFTYHHQPFNYFSDFSRNTLSGRANREQHLRDLVEFNQKVGKSDRQCQLPRVSFIKYMRLENQHPGIRPAKGDMTAVKQIRGIENSACAKGTMVILTYDEYGGAWDHVPPPGQGGETPGPSDQWGPGTRIPAIIVSPLLANRLAVDHISHDTTSIAATIEDRFHLKPLTARDAKVNDLSSVFSSTAP